MKQIFSWQNKNFRMLVWSVFNAVISFVLTILIAPEYAAYSPILVPLLNMFTKYINEKYF
jgi:hypothetical protein